MSVGLREFAVAVAYEDPVDPREWRHDLGMAVAARLATECSDWNRCSAAIWIGSRIASPEMFPEAEMLPHLICSRPMFIGGAKDEADQHGGA